MTQFRRAGRAMYGRRLAAVATSVVSAALVTGTLDAGAQVPPVDPFPTTTTTTAPPQQTTTTAAPLAAVLPGPAVTTTTVRKPPPGPDEGRGPDGKLPPVPGDGAGEGMRPPPDAGAFPAHLAAMTASVRRTRPGNTKALVEALGPLVDMGVPRETALRVGMGRFPVGGYATYSHDWWFPRFGPGWRLHLGTDIFAAKGTPVRAPGDGAVRLVNGGLGGMATYVVQADGTYFYLAHLDGWPPGLRDGQSVATGDTVGYVGNSGNAVGGAYHLHFEIHPAPTKTITRGKGRSRTTQVVTVPVRPGTVLPAADPKSWLDRALQDAMAAVPGLIAQYQADPSLIPVAAPGEGDVAGAIVDPEAAGDLADAPYGDPLASSTGVLAASQPIARVPLAAFAGLLVVLVGALTPVFAPQRLLLPPPVLPAEPPARRRRRGGGSAPTVPATPEPAEPTARRRRRGGGSPPTNPATPEPAARRRRRRGGSPPTAATPEPAEPTAGRRRRRERPAPAAAATPETAQPTGRRRRRASSSP